MAQGIWKNVAGVFGGKRDTTVESLCPAGLHQVDPNWQRQGKPCPYCRAPGDAGRSASSMESKAPAPAPQREQTRADDHAAPAAPAMASQAASPRPPGRDHTVVDDLPAPAPSPDRHVGGGRRIQAVLTTYSWSGTGELFVIRDGRNYVGSGNVAAENNAPCEVLIRNDGRLSSAHFMILYQGGRPLVSDLLSLNGTTVDGQPVDGRGVELADNAVIKAGDTVFVFQRIKRTGTVPGVHVSPSGPAPQRRDEPPPHRPETLVN
jgi:hypothetical protein